MYAIVRVRGYVKVNKDIEHTMKLLNLTRVNHCVIYQETEKIKGMIHKARGYLTYGEISKEVLKKMLLKRALVYDERGKGHKFSEIYKEAKEQEIIIEEIYSSKKKLNDFGIKPVFRLKAPSKGYERKGVKKTFKEGGALGYRGSEINKLLKKMI
jgi:large subunit ribosomal protein L30